MSPISITTTDERPRGRASCCAAKALALLRSTPLSLAALSLLMAACHTGSGEPYLSVRPSAITPDMDGDADVAEISYRIDRSARIDLLLIGSDETSFPLRADKLRQPGDYVAAFGGVLDGRMLPDDDYRVELRIRPLEPEGEPEQRLTASLSLRGGDKDPPRIEDLAVVPERFTPNQDGIGDRVDISYRIDEPAELRLWLEHADGRYETDILETAESAEFAGEPGAHVYDFDAGVDADAPPPPDGVYRIVAEARDQSGNVSRESITLTIESGGQPRAALTGDLSWDAEIVPLGQTLHFSATVENIGATPIRSLGPEPGFVYDNDETFNRAAEPGFLLLARRGSLESSDYRVATRFLAWPEAVGGQTEIGDLALVEFDETASSAQVSAATQVLDDSETTGDDLRICGRALLANGRPAAGAEVYAFAPDGDRGRVGIADNRGRFCVERLSPGYVSSRSFARSSGAIRFGIEYDEKRTDLPYPFRWQLGPTAGLDVCRSDERYFLCLPPGARRQVWGGIRFQQAPFRRSTTIYGALLHEDVRRMQGPFDPQRLTIESP